MLRRWIFCAMIMLAAAAPAAELSFANFVTCSAAAASTTTINGRCDGGLAVSGDASSTILIKDIPGTAAVPVTFFQDESATITTEPCSAPGRVLKIVIVKRRHLVPLWMSKAGRLFVKADAEVKPSCDRLLLIVDAVSPDLTFSVGDQPFTVPIRNQRWWLETGGFYSYSWARDDQLVTKNVTVDGAAKIQVVARRKGDRIGPATGVTFVFHPGDFPEYGWEFGTATNGGHTNYYLGSTVRLIQYNDRALLTVGAGVSHVSVIQYPEIVMNDSAGHVINYAPDDPLLAGRTHYINKPYVSLGLGINLGGPQQGKSSSP
jgi:hypothetical protein